MDKTIADNTIGQYRIIAIQFTQKELKDMLPKAQKQLDNYKAVIDYKEDENEDFGYIGTVEDVAIGNLLAQTLRNKLQMPLLDCEAHEEEGYGLPEYSVYYNQDARSWCGKWTHSNNPENIDECGIFFALLPSDNPHYKQIQNLVDKLLEKENVAVAIIERL